MSLLVLLVIYFSSIVLTFVICGYFNRDTEDNFYMNKCFCWWFVLLSIIPYLGTSLVVVLGLVLIVDKLSKNSNIFK